MKKTGMIIGLLVEVVLVLVLMFYTDDIKWFFLYFLIVFYFNSYFWGNYLRKLIRVYQVANEVKIMGIIKKLGVSEEELQEIGDEVENNLTVDQRKSLYKDMDDLGLK
ncbi:MAG: hypothetical protein V1848_02990 [Candidatus Magasanikbacteria bacterium]